MAHGPSFSLALGKMSFGISTSVKSFTDIRNMPQPYYNYMLNSFQLPEQFNEDYSFKNIRVNSLTYAEFGLNYGQILRQRGNELITGGITLKRVIGIQGVGVQLNELSMTVFDSTQAYFKKINGNIDVSDPA